MRRRVVAIGERLVSRVGLYRLARNTYQRLFKRSTTLVQRRRVQTFFRQFVAPGDLVFDVGASVGDLTAEFLELGARVVAVEPLPLAAQRLATRYGSSRNVVLERVALGPESGEAEMRIGVHHFLSTISPDRIAARPELWRETISVPVLTLDQLIERHGLPRFLKVDVEGYERDVLRGLTQPVEALSFEFGLVELELVAQCVEHLETLGTYEFNVSRGYEYRLRFDPWLDGGALVGCVRDWSERGTADVYARRC